MLLSLGLIFLVGLAVGDICKKIHLPHVVGMLLSGIVLGPYVLDLLAPDILNISSELRQAALVIILLKAGLSLNLADLKQIGRFAVLMSFVPAGLEILTYSFLAPLLFDISTIDAMVMGAVLAAVSPAVVVPRMVNLIEQRYGTKKSIPQMILASASLDDIIVIVIFTVFLSMADSGAVNLLGLLDIPVSIISAAVVGSVCGLILCRFFRQGQKADSSLTDSKKTIVLLGLSLILVTLDAYTSIAFSGLLCVVIVAAVIKLKSEKTISVTLSDRFGKLWIAAEILLFVLVGAAVDIDYLLSAGPAALAIIFAGLAARSIGVVVSLIGSKLNAHERLFCVIAYIPKATVQAAIGSVALSTGLAGGEIILTVAVLSIVVTAPLGAIGMDCFYRRLLAQEQGNSKG